MFLPPDNVQVRCIGHYRQKSRCVHLWLTIGLRYSCVEQQIKPQQETPDWSTVCVWARRVLP
jgi:hypothetical protein